MFIVDRPYFYVIFFFLHLNILNVFQLITTCHFQNQFEILKSTEHVVCFEMEYNFYFKD